MGDSVTADPDDDTHAFRRIFTVALRGIPGPGCPLEPLLLATLLAVPAHRGIPHKKIRR